MVCGWAYTTSYRMKVRIVSPPPSSARMKGRSVVVYATHAEKGLVHNILQNGIYVRESPQLYFPFATKMVRPLPMVLGGVGANTRGHSELMHYIQFT